MLLAAAACFAVAALAAGGLPSTATVAVRPWTSDGAARHRARDRRDSRPSGAPSHDRALRRQERRAWSSHRPDRRRLAPALRGGRRRCRLADGGRRSGRRPGRDRRGEPRRPPPSRAADAAGDHALGRSLPRDRGRAAADRCDHGARRPRNRQQRHGRCRVHARGSIGARRRARACLRRSRGDPCAGDHGRGRRRRHSWPPSGSPHVALRRRWGPRRSRSGRTLRRRAETAEPSAEYLELLRSNPIFAWLAPVGLERLASGLEPLELAKARAPAAGGERRSGLSPGGGRAGRTARRP